MKNNRFGNIYLKTESHTFLKASGLKNLKMSTISTIILKRMNSNRWASSLSNISFLREFITVYAKKPIKTVKAGSRLYMGFEGHINIYL